MSHAISRFHGRFFPGVPRRITVAIGGAMLIAAVTTFAMREAQAQASGANQPCNDIRSAVTVSMQNHMTIVNTFMTPASAQAQAAITSRGSCLNVMLQGLDFSNMIPDFGLLQAILTTAVNKFVDSLINRVCAAANSAIGSVAGTWNSAVGQLNNGLNMNGQMNDWGRNLDYRIQDTVSSIPTNIIGSPTTGPSNGGGALPTPTTPGVTCVTTVNGRYCTDGSSQPNPTSPTGGDSGSGTGAQFGYQLATALQQCTQAVAEHRRLQNSEQGGSNMAAVNQNCSRLQNLITSNPSLAAGVSFPLSQIQPEFNLVIPSATASANVSTATDGQPAFGAIEQRNYSLPVRK